MLDINLNIPASVEQRFLDAISLKFDFQKNSLSSEEPVDFLKRMLIDTLMQWVIDGERGALVATEEANRVSLEKDIQKNIVIS